MYLLISAAMIGAALIISAKELARSLAHPVIAGMATLLAVAYLADGENARHIADLRFRAHSGGSPYLNSEERFKKEEEAEEAKTTLRNIEASWLDLASSIYREAGKHLSG